MFSSVIKTFKNAKPKTPQEREAKEDMWVNSSCPAKHSLWHFLVDCN